MSTAPAPKQQLKLKLRQSPGSETNTPGARTSATPGIIVDNEALLRQQRHVLESMNGPRSSRVDSASKSGTPGAASNPFSGQRGNSGSIPTLGSGQVKSSATPPVLNGVKQDIQSPALSAIRPASGVSDGTQQRMGASTHAQHPFMGPPQAVSGSPWPNGPFSGPAPVNGQYQAPSYYVPPTALRVDTFRPTPLNSKHSRSSRVTY